LLIVTSRLDANGVERRFRIAKLSALEDAGWMRLQHGESKAARMLENGVRAAIAMRAEVGLPYQACQFAPAEIFWCRIAEQARKQLLFS
jgi:hypothetical protein